MSVQEGRTSLASETSTLKVGDRAPDFELRGHRGGESVRLSSFKGEKNVVIVFYPLDWTAVWTVQMPSYEANSGKFAGLDAQVLGVSVDSVASHVAWAETFGGIHTYSLLADFHPKAAVAKMYGVYREEKGSSHRAVFIIDKEGIVRYIDVHDAGEMPLTSQILAELEKL